MKKLRHINPWGAPKESPETPKPSAAGATVEAPPDTYRKGDSDLSTPPSALLEVQGYGRVKVERAGTPTEALLRILDFFLAHMKELDATLVHHGILVAQFEELPVQGYYVHRNWDNWTLAIPEAPSMQSAMFQLIQALLVIGRGPLRSALERAGIHPAQL